MAETTMGEQEAAFYLGAVWGHRMARQNAGPLNGGDICVEFLRCFRKAAPTPETET
jgi:hypothetical protein